MSELPFGIDLSRYQFGSDGKQKPDFDKINATCDFVGVRAGISWGYIDPWFRYSWEHLDVPRLAYHVVYPGEIAARQMDHFLNIVKPQEHDRLVLDVELDHGYSKARIANTLLECLEFILANTGRYPIIYSRASWINQFVDVSALPSNVDWWLAGYLKPLPSPLYTKEATPPPALPKGVTKWLIHQTAERGNGSAVGVVSHYVDIDRWNGTKEQLLAYFGLGEEVPAPPVEPPVSKPLYCARVITDPGWRLNVRETAGGRVVGSLDSGDLVNVWEETGDWARIGDGRWVSMHWIARVENSPEEPEGEVRFEAIVVTTYDWLPVREKPGYFEKEVRRIYKGDRIKVYEANKDRWYRIGNNEWCYGARCRSLTEPVSTLLYPMASKFPISQRFGVNSATYAASKGHNGVDWASWRGTKLIAAADGYVETVELYTTYGYGRHCRIRIQGGVLIYGHMLEVFVTEGQRVKAGEVIGLSDGEKGNKYAGFSTGAHLHFEYRIDREPSPLKAGNYTYWAIDPLPLIKE